MHHQGCAAWVSVGILAVCQVGLDLSVAQGVEEGVHGAGLGVPNSVGWFHLYVFIVEFLAFE